MKYLVITRTCSHLGIPFSLLTQPPPNNFFYTLFHLCCPYPIFLLIFLIILFINYRVNIILIAQHVLYYECPLNCFYFHFHFYDCSKRSARRREREKNERELDVERLERGFLLYFNGSNASLKQAHTATAAAAAAPDTALPTQMAPIEIKKPTSGAISPV